MALSQDKFDDKTFTKNSHDWDEVIERKSQPNLIIFKTLSMDEEVELINQTTKVVVQGVTVKRENEESEREEESQLKEHPTRCRKTKYPKN